MLAGSASGAAMACSVLAKASFGELKVDAEGLALAVDEVSEFGARAVCRLSVAEGLLPALSHVLMGPAEADNAERLGLLGRAGTKGIGWCCASPLVRVGVGRVRTCAVRGTRISHSLAPCLARWAYGGIVRWGGEHGHGLSVNRHREE
jgi:hypothetical protein